MVITATDDGNHGAGPALRAVASMTLRVRDADTAPILAPVGDQTGTEGQAFTLLLAARDAEGDGIGYSATGLPRGAVLDLRTGLLRWTPGFDQAGHYQ